MEKYKLVPVKRLRRDEYSGDRVVETSYPYVCYVNKYTSIFINETLEGRYTVELHESTTNNVWLAEYFTDTVARIIAEHVLEDLKEGHSRMTIVNRYGLIHTSHNIL